MDFAIKEIFKYITNIEYPVYKEGVLEEAHNNGAPYEIMASLENLPDERFDSQKELNANLA